MKNSKKKALEDVGYKPEEIKKIKKIKKKKVEVKLKERYIG